MTELNQLFKSLLKPSQPLRVIELFGGIGAMHQALKNLGVNYELVDMVEWDVKPLKIYNAIHHTNFLPQDVTQWNKNVKCDYLHASTPCQAFSIAGKNLGANDIRGAPLWEATLKIIQRTEPKIITLENVKGLLQKKHQALLNYYLDSLTQLGYHNLVKVYNAKHFGIPQSRERVFIISWKRDLPTPDFPHQLYETKYLKDILQADAKWEVAENIIHCGEYLYFENKLSNYYGKTIEAKLEKLDLPLQNEIIVNGRLRDNDFKTLLNETTIKPIEELKFNQDNAFLNINGVCSTLTTSAADFKNKILELNYNNASVFLSTNGTTKTISTNSDTPFHSKILDMKDYTLRYRRLTNLELFRLMGFDDKHYQLAEQVATKNEIIKAAGNSMVVSVIQYIIQHLIKIIRKEE